MAKKLPDPPALVARDAGSARASRARRVASDFHVQLGQVIHDARTGANLTQQQLADRAGTTQPVIARLEAAHYDGHSLAMLRRIARALNQRLEVRLVGAGRRPATAKRAAGSRSAGARASNSRRGGSRARGASAGRSRARASRSGRSR
jgi:transcriptional regulator with XRE-family HTH domain